MADKAIRIRVLDSLGEDVPLRVNYDGHDWIVREHIQTGARRVLKLFRFELEKPWLEWPPGQRWLGFGGMPHAKLHQPQVAFTRLVETDAAGNVVDDSESMERSDA